MSQTYEIGIMAGKNVAAAIDAFFESESAKENWGNHEKKVLNDGTSMYRTKQRNHPSHYTIGKAFLEILRSFQNSNDTDDAVRCIMVSEEGFTDEVSNTIGQQVFEDFTSLKEINYPDGFEDTEPEYIKEIKEKLKNCDTEQASQTMTGLLMDTDTTTRDMFEDLCYRYISENNDFKKGMDAALSILLGYNLSEIAGMISD